MNENIVLFLVVLFSIKRITICIIIPVIIQLIYYISISHLPFCVHTNPTELIIFLLNWKLQISSMKHLHNFKSADFPVYAVRLSTMLCKKKKRFKHLFTLYVQTVIWMLF